MKARGGRLEEPAAARAIQCTLLALSSIHGVGLAHRDVKPENLLLRGDHVGTVCLCDFGAVTHVDPAGSAAPSSPASWKVSSLDNAAGTPLFMSPGAVNGQPASFKDDIWAVGVTLYELIYGRNPFIEAPSMTDLFNMIASCRIEPPSGPSEGARAFISWLMNPDEDRRPTAALASTDPWLTSTAAAYLPEADTAKLSPQHEDSFAVPISKKNFAVSGAYVFMDETGTLRLNERTNDTFGTGARDTVSDEEDESESANSGTF